MIQKHHPDKRTKAQVLRLLDNALHQEEKLVQKIQALEAQLADCQKRAEDPRYEITESALPSSKVSFRIDFYRTEKRGPVKGVIEHLSSRETRSFTGQEAGMDTLQAFISKHLPIKARPASQVTAPPSPFAAEEPPAIPPSHAAASAEPLPAAPLPDLPEAPDAPVSPYEQPAPAAPMHEEQPAPAAVSALPEHSAAPASAPAALVATRRPEPPGEGRLADRIRRRLGLSESGPAGGQEVGSSSLAERQSPAPVSTPALVSGGSMQVVAAGQAIQHRSLRHGQHFQVEIPALQRADFQGKTCQVRLTAENLETGETMRLASALAPLPQQALRLPSAGQQLEPGGYRLTAVVHLQADPGQVFFRESRLLVVNAEA